MKYFNNSGAGLMSDATISALHSHLILEQKVGASKAAEINKERIDDFYTQAGNIINAKSENISFVDSASRAWNIAIYGTRLQPGDKVLTLASEFGTNLVVLEDYCKKFKLNLIIFPTDLNGYFDIFEFEKVLSQNVKLIAISDMGAHGAIQNPVKRIGELCSTYNSLYYVDGCQSVGQVQVDVKKINCDVYTTTGRKWLRGPRGTGFIYVKNLNQIQPTQFDLAVADLKFTKKKEINGLIIREDSKKFELWERSIASQIAFGSAMKEYNEYGIHKIHLIAKYSKLIKEQVRKNKKLILIGDYKSDNSIIGVVGKSQESHEELISMLNKNNIVFSKMHEWDSPILFSKYKTNSIVRLSPHYYTRKEDVNFLCQTLIRV